MSMLTRRRIAWLVLNVAAAVFLPLFFGWWLERQVHSSDAPLPEEVSPETFLLIFTIAWGTFLLLLNVTVAVFLWLKRR